MAPLRGIRDEGFMLQKIKFIRSTIRKTALRDTQKPMLNPHSVVVPKIFNQMEVQFIVIENSSFQ